MEVPRHNVKSRNVESSPHEVIEEAATHADDHTENPVPNSTGERESSAYVGHSVGED
jgi:hypothetical protein